MNGRSPLVHTVAAEGFARGADAYERARPSYPAEAVDHLVGELGIGPGSRVLDLAAGTGKLTRLLVPTGAELLAIEPVAEMRRHLSAAVPGVGCIDGTAERLPLVGASLDAITCAQAWHWFDSPAALAEAARVLRRGAGLAVVFNIRDDRVAWVRELSRVTEFLDATRPHHAETRRRFADDVATDGRFGPVALSSFAHTQELDEDGLVERAASQSNVAVMDDRRRAEVLDAVRDLARTHLELAGRTSFSLPYVTEIALCRRR